MCREKPDRQIPRLLKLAVLLGGFVIIFLAANNGDKRDERQLKEPAPLNQPIDSTYKHSESIIKLHLPITVVIS